MLNVHTTNNLTDGYIQIRTLLPIHQLGERIEVVRLRHTDLVFQLRGAVPVTPVKILMVKSVEYIQSGILIY